MNTLHTDIYYIDLIKFIIEGKYLDDTQALRFFRTVTQCVRPLCE